MLAPVPDVSVLQQVTRAACLQQVTSIGLFNSNLDLAGADGISETLAIDKPSRWADGPMADGPMGGWADGSLVVGIRGLGQLCAQSGLSAG